MNKKYIEMTNQLIQSYHIEENDLDDLELYYKLKLEEIENRRNLYKRLYK